jgi:hypothetical protein
MAATPTPGRCFRARTPPAVEPIPEPMPNAYMVKVLLALFVGLGRRRTVPGEAAAVAAEHGI